MKNKELENVLKDIEQLIKKLELGNVKSELVRELERACNEPATISIEKKANGEACTKIEGTRLAILITLAGLEKSILEKLNPPTEMWEMIKGMVGTKEVDNG